jgi:hypothetical protein
VCYKFPHSILGTGNLYIVHQKRASAMINRNWEESLRSLNCDAPHAPAAGTWRASVGVNLAAEESFYRAYCSEISTFGN